MGTHPTMKNYHYFNGLGAKGYMLAPRLSFEFAEYLLKNKALNKFFDIILNVIEHVKNLLANILEFATKPGNTKWQKIVSFFKFRF